MSLKNEFDEICQKYIDEFCKKQDLQFNYWIGDMVGTIAEISDCCFDFEDIRYDVDTAQESGLIYKWFWDNLERKNKINYRNYTKINYKN